jgi:hypothetical protein
MVTATQKIWGIEVKYPVATSNMMLKTNEICRLRADSTLFESKELTVLDTCVKRNKDLMPPSS